MEESQSVQYRTEAGRPGRPLLHQFFGFAPGNVSECGRIQERGGETAKRIEPVNGGTDIQGMFFDLWRQEHADIDLEPVPADMVMASGSGLDPHITLKNALYQLDRVAAWQAGNIAEVSQELEEMLHKNATAPLGDLVGVKLVNVLEVNLILRERFGKANR